MSRSLWFNRKGEPVSDDQGARSLASDRVVKQEDTVDSAGRHWFVSTIFLGIDHSFDSAGPPLLFETMVFGYKAPSKLGNPKGIDGNDRYSNRYSTEEEALAGHETALALVHEWGTEIQ